MFARVQLVSMAGASVSQQAVSDIRLKRGGVDVYYRLARTGQQLSLHPDPTP